MTKAKKSTRKQNGYRIYTQYILIGAALGLYYGLFYKSSQAEPDYLMALTLAVAAALLTTAVRNWKKRSDFRTLALDFFKILAMFLAFLLALQLNIVVDRIGGRIAVVVFMTSVGVILGFLMSLRKKTKA